MLAAKQSIPWLASLAVASVLFAPLAQAQSAGEVEFSRGVGFAQTPGETPRTLGRGLPLREGDRLTTSEGATAIIKLQDGTRMTVRPNSELVLQQYQFRESAPDNSMLMQLVRGGFRAVTGLISKNAPNAARIQTSTATIGIRGTDFDARLCTGDCGQESNRIPDAARPNAVLASAKVTGVRGDLFAVDGAGGRRQLVDGGSVYPGELVETARGGQAVLVFRDQTRISLGSQTRFRLDNFVYDESNAGEGRFLASILRGSVRALTGLIARANTRNVGFSTATATIGIRGTDVTILTDENHVVVTVSDGAVSFTFRNQTVIIRAGEGIHARPDGTFTRGAIARIQEELLKTAQGQQLLEALGGLQGLTDAVNQAASRRPPGLPADEVPPGPPSTTPGPGGPPGGGAGGGGPASRS